MRNIRGVAMPSFTPSVAASFVVFLPSCPSQGEHLTRIPTVGNARSRQMLPGNVGVPFRMRRLILNTVSLVILLILLRALPRLPLRVVVVASVPCPTRDGAILIVTSTKRGEERRVRRFVKDTVRRRPDNPFNTTHAVAVIVMLTIAVMTRKL